MKIKHDQIEIPTENPFKNCKLDRKPYAEILTNIVQTYADGFVLAINNEWGTGKTTFVRMWQQMLKQNGFQTIYFNAWENDFDGNPLIALLSEFQTLEYPSKNTDQTFKSIVEKGAVLIRNVVPAIAKGIANKYIDSDLIVELIENSTKATTEILEHELKQYASKKQTMVEFRLELEKYVRQSCGTYPLVFIIDELDRCRPNYAVEVLEQVKHLFSVSGVVFVLSIDKKHLASSVKGFYGSNEINTDEYLRRFIDLEYSIPAHSTESSVKYLYSYFEINDFFSSMERNRYSDFNNDSTTFKKTAIFLFKKNKTTLRLQERIFSFTRLVLSSFEYSSYVIPPIFFILIYLKYTEEDLYHSLVESKISVQELSSKLDVILNPLPDDQTEINIGYIQALLLWLYNNNKTHKREKLLQNDNEGKSTTPIHSELIKNEELKKHFMDITNVSISDLELKYFTNKINLLEPIQA